MGFEKIKENIYFLQAYRNKRNIEIIFTSL